MVCKNALAERVNTLGAWRQSRERAVMKSWPIQLEISGPSAMWTRPDTGSSPVSYVAPTYNAVKWIFEALLLWRPVALRPARCAK
jgi:CRISPR-associated Cas5-like protein